MGRQREAPPAAPVRCGAPGLGLGVGAGLGLGLGGQLRLQLLYAVGHLALEMLDKVAREAQAERAIAHQRQPAHTADGLVPK